MQKLKIELSKEDKIKYKEMEIEDVVAELKQRNPDVANYSINEAAVWIKGEALK